MKTLSPPPPGPPSREDPGAEDQRHFRRNLIAVGACHAVILLVLVVAGFLRPRPKPVEVLWLDGSSLGGSESASAEPDPPTIEEPEPPPAKLDEPIPEQPTLPVNKEPASEIAVPKATPTPATPKPATPKPATPKPSTPKPATPKLSPAEKRKATPAASPKPKSGASPKPAGTPDAKKKEGEKTGDKNPAAGSKPGASGGDAGGKGKTGSGTGGGISQFGWYTDMLHDRYYSRWEQPVGIGQDVVTTVRLRIMKDGTISKHDMVKSSGNPQMDESVMSAVEKVQQIDPLPAGLGNGEYFDLNVAFKVGG